MKGLLSILREELPQAKPIVTEGGTSDVDQSTLRGDLDLIRKAVASTPNTSDRFPTRESYRDFGYAIKAALPDHPHEAYEIYLDWCARWQDGTNSPDVVEADWRRMKPPFRRGASYIYDLAEQHSGGAFSKAEQWYQPIADYEPLFPDDLPKSFSDREDTFEVLGIDQILKREPPKFLIARHIPETSMGFLYSEPGVGKSFIALDLALHIAYGRKEWHGDAINAPDDTVVLYLASEGSFGFRNRIKAWLKRHGITGASDRFKMIERTINFMEAEDIEKLLRTVKSVIGKRPVLIVVDTVSRAMPGADENLQKEMTLFVRACDRLKETFGCAVMGVHHAGKNGDMRGSTVLRGAGDFVFRLQRKQGATVGKLECEKQKDAPDGWGDPYEFCLIAFGEGETSLVPVRAEANIGPAVALTPDLSALVLDAMEKAWAAGEPWGKTYHAKERQASRKMVREFGFTMEKAEEVLALWEATGTIAEDILSKKDKRKGFRVVREGAAEEGEPDSIFA